MKDQSGIRKQEIPADDLKRIDKAREQDSIDWKYGSYGKRVAGSAFKRGAIAEFLHHLNSQSPSPVGEAGARWVKGEKPADGIKDQVIHVKPFEKFHSYEVLPKTYHALIYMGNSNDGFDWHWYEGPNSAWHTKISDEDWKQIERLDESPNPQRAGEQYTREKAKQIAKDCTREFCGLPSEFDKYFDDTYPAKTEKALETYSREEVIKIGEDFDDYLCAALSNSNVIMEFDEWFDTNHPAKTDRAGEISPVLRWVKGRRPTDGIEGQVIPIKPIVINDAYGYPIRYYSLIWFGKPEVGLKLYWHEGPHKGGDTTIKDEDWDKIEWLEDIPLTPAPKVKERAKPDEIPE